MQAIFPINLRDIGINVVCFDLGGVLVRIASSWRSAADRIGISIDSGWESSLSNSNLLNLLQVGGLSDLAYAADLADGLKTTIPDAISIHQSILIEEYSGATELLQIIHGAGLASACLSNTNELHWQEMTNGRFPSVAAIHHQFLSHRVGLAKPDPEIYRKFEDTFGFESHRIIFFDDNEPNVQSARNRGWHAWHITEGDPIAQIKTILRI